MEVVGLRHDGHPEEYEDDAVTDGGQGPGGGLDGDVTVPADVDHRVPLNHQTKRDETEDARPLHEVCGNVGEVGKHEEQVGLNFSD